MLLGFLFFIWDFEIGFLGFLGFVNFVFIYVFVIINAYIVFRFFCMFLSLINARCSGPASAVVYFLESGGGFTV